MQQGINIMFNLCLVTCAVALAFCLVACTPAPLQQTSRCLALAVAAALLGIALLEAGLVFACSRAALLLCLALCPATLVGVHGCLAHVAACVASSCALAVAFLVGRDIAA